MSAGGSCPAVVSADWLADALKTPNNKIRVLDVTWSGEKDERQSYLKSHISGAGYFNLKQDVPTDTLQPYPLPSAEGFTKQVRSLGINSDTHVVVYERTEGKCGFFFGGRVWMMFKVFGHQLVSVLDGGINKWNGPVDDAVPTFPEGDFSAVCDDKLIWQFEDLTGKLNSGDFQMIDTRPPPLYNGNAADAKSGHVPGFRCLPFGRFLDTERGVLKTAEQLGQVLEDFGLDFEKPCVVMCNGGLTSCTFLLTLYMLGATTESHLYLGGYLEWQKRCSPDQIVKTC